LETDVNLAEIVYERAVIAWDINIYNDDFDGTAFQGVFEGNEYKFILPKRFIIGLKIIKLQYII
jgi:hypothetical protein